MNSASGCLREQGRIMTTGDFDYRFPVANYPNFCKSNKSEVKGLDFIVTIGVEEVKCDKCGQEFSVKNKLVT